MWFHAGKTTGLRIASLGIEVDILNYCDNE